MRQHNRWMVVFIALVLIFTLGCSVGQLIAGKPTPTPVQARTPRPTFTPTPSETGGQGDKETRGQEEGLPLSPSPPLLVTDTPTLEPTPTDTPVPMPPTPTPVPPPPTDTPVPPTSTPEPLPFVLVTSDRVNVRNGPGTAYQQVGQVTQGQRLDIVGKNAAGDWWQVCCVNGQQVWITGSLVQAQGNLGGVLVAANIPAPPPTARPQPTATSAPTSTPVPSYPYRFAEVTGYPTTNTWLSVFGKIWDPKTEQGIAGLQVKFTRNGVDASPPLSEPSRPAQKATEWGDTSNPYAGDNRKQNYKYEGPDQNTATWEAWVVDGSGNPLSDRATFATDLANLRWFYIQFDRK